MVVKNVYDHLQCNFVTTAFSYEVGKTRTQLGPSSSLDYQAGFTLSRFYTTFQGPRLSNTF